VGQEGLRGYMLREIEGVEGKNESAREGTREGEREREGEQGEKIYMPPFLETAHALSLPIQM
jgi:hypothetical protein